MNVRRCSYLKEKAPRIYLYRCHGSVLQYLRVRTLVVRVDLQSLAVLTDGLLVSAALESCIAFFLHSVQLLYHSEVLYAIFEIWVAVQRLPEMLQSLLVLPLTVQSPPSQHQCLWILVVLAE